MKYEKAVQYKKEFLEKVHESIPKYYYIIITPAIANESERYIGEFLKNPKLFNDKNSRKYSSNDDYIVVSFEKSDVYEKK
ncbi:hypothetical protein D1631_12210 [Chryseobacterium nematophagum]|uniref:Uncharacterized protein n=1 Tax=Chryseobacterium nematophagum TaxID=2305228 RepID=A0A3M7THS1_9FLAO|nr:hypothetical protein [Chryseobacterium nematophagum]RNA62644.1 hypothetical protein D1631_12210 [Chryseobacterium nematophagum]